MRQLLRSIYNRVFVPIRFISENPGASVQFFMALLILWVAKIKSDTNILNV
jgi:hypothetical protein